MTKQEVYLAIEEFSDEELDDLIRWIKEKKWEAWDHQIEADSEAGRLDHLVEEALAEKAKGNLRDL